MATLALDGAWKDMGIVWMTGRARVPIVPCFPDTRPQQALAPFDAGRDDIVDFGCDNCYLVPSDVGDIAIGKPPERMKRMRDVPLSLRD